MAITTNFTNLKGDTGDSIVVENLVQSSVAGTDTTFDLVQKDASGATINTTAVTVQGGVAGATILTGTTAPDVADGNIGDIYINTDTDELFQKVAADDWGTASDFTGDKGDKGDKGDTGDAGAGFNAYDTTGATTYTIGTTVISSNTQWRALRESLNITPAEGDDWSEISTLSQDQFVTSIDDLSDVDTTTTAPVDGDTLVWATDEWIPGTPASGGGLFGEFDLARNAATSNIGVLRHYIQ